MIYLAIKQRFVAAWKGANDILDQPELSFSIPEYLIM